jgi:RNA polymerase sigma factor (sigma-70 family)
VNSISKAEELFELHAPYIYKAALLMTRSRTIADDITQETFLRFFQKYHLYDEQKPIKPWLYRIAVNVTRNTLRKQKWLSFWGEVINSEKIDSAEDQFMITQRDQELWSTVHTLSSKLKQIIILRYHSELSINEIAEILQIPLGTCKSRLHTALNIMKLTLIEKGGVPDETERR